MSLVRILPATVPQLEALTRDPQEFSALLHSPVPNGWPEFPESIPYTLTTLQERPSEAAWWMYFFLDSSTGPLVGSGGFAGPPRDRQVEIGYEIAPEHRRRGYATAAARALVLEATASGQVDVVVAHTLDSHGLSARVLQTAGFQKSGHAVDPEHGRLTNWSRRIDSA
jgi:RimJ/RimL family protein N-acetyltransferase